MIEYIRHFKLKYGLTFFDEFYDNQKVDIVREFQYSKKRLFSEDFYTLFINLTETEEIIFSRLEKNTKYEINRAKKKDSITITTIDAQKDKYLFYDFYDKFAASKNLRPIGREEVDLLIDNNMFIIRTASFNNEHLVFHSYITANSRARLMQSASLFREADEVSYRNMIGRANRLLHWEDILYFKDQGYKIYDLGGITLDESNKERQAITRFKRCFGGTVVKEYKSWIPISLKGWVLACFKVLTGRL